MLFYIPCNLNVLAFELPVNKGQHFELGRRVGADDSEAALNPSRLVLYHSVCFLTSAARTASCAADELKDLSEDVVYVGLSRASPFWF